MTESQAQLKGKNMEKHTATITIDKHPASKRPKVDEMKGRVKYHSEPFRPKATLLLDIAPTQGDKLAGRNTM
jgi:hypothetical protein